MKSLTFALLFVVAGMVGCKPSKEPGLVEKVHNKVKETINAQELHGLQEYIAYHEVEFNRMPTKDEIKAFAKKENPRLSKLLEDGTLVLTGTTKRDGVWAYEKDAPTKGGWAITASGESIMTPEELNQKLGK